MNGVRQAGATVGRTEAVARMVRVPSGRRLLYRVDNIMSYARRRERALGTRISDGNNIIFYALHNRHTGLFLDVAR